METYDFSLSAVGVDICSAPKEMGSNKQEQGDGEIRRLVHTIRLKKGEICGIIRYRNSGGNYAYLYIHTGRKIRLG